LTRQPKQAAGSSGREEIRAGDLFLLPLAGAQAMLDAWLGWFGDHRKPPFDDEAALPWTMPHRVTLELTTLRLRDFSGQKAGRPVLICAPYALHSALITDFAPAHSIVQALQQGGVSRVHVTDWRSATPQMRSLSIDSYLADLNVASILAWARPAQIDMSAFPKVAEWLRICADRPAARAVRQLQRE